MKDGIKKFMNGTKMEQIKPKVTVVTVTYNAEKYLEQTIKSVIEQDYPNIEYIIIDGASTDGTIDIIKKYEKHINYWVSEPDNGIYDAMNKGIDASTGEWINFMNAGDSLNDFKIISNMIQSIDNDTNIFYGGTNFINELGDVVFYEPAYPIETLKTKFPFTHQALFLKYNLVCNNLFNLNYRYASDVDQFFRIYYSNYIKIKVLDYPVVNYLNGGFWQQNKGKAHIEVLHIVSKYFSIEQIYNHTSYFALQNYNPFSNLMNNYMFSLQFNKILKQLEELKENNYIAIYGYGNFGKYLQYYFGNKVIMIVDRCYDEINSFEPRLLNNCPFEVIIISVLGREKEIREYLEKELQITSSKIVEIVC